MQKFQVIALIVALACGLGVGTQASLNNAASRLAGPILTGLLVNFLGGVASGVILAGIFMRQGAGFFSAVRGSTFNILILAGLLGIAIISGAAYALPRIGVAAGLAAVIVGQMVVAIAVDTLALVGGQPISLSWIRIGGLALLALGTWMILPKG
jgi:bacterial/archaeal transporter family-2 protein